MCSDEGHPTVIVRSAPLHAVVEAIAAPLAVVDQDLRFLCANAAWIAWRGGPVDGVVGLRVHDVAPDLMATCLRAALFALHARLDPAHAPTPSRVADPTGVLATPWITDPDGFAGLVLHRPGPTASAQADRAAAEVAHELRAPIAGIIEAARLAAGGGETRPEHAAHIDTIVRTAEHLLGVVNRFVERHAGGPRATPAADAWVDVRALLDDVAGAMGPLASSAGVALVVSVGEGVPESVPADALAVRQVLFNLVSNAIRHSGSPRVVLSAEAGAGEGPLTLSVNDEGRGLDASQMRGLQNAASPDGAAEPVRRGLGLSICRQLAADLGAELTASSNPTGGTTLSLRLGASGMPPGPLAGCRVLIVDDCPHARHVYKHFLGAAGASLSFAESLTEARAVAASAAEAGGAWHAVLLDARLDTPGGSEDGLQLVPELRARFPAARFMAVTACCAPADRQRALRAGCDHHISKPVDWPALVDLLAATLVDGRETATPPAWAAGAGGAGGTGPRVPHVPLGAA